MIIKTRGICLHTTKYGESSVIAQVYTEEKGLQSYIIAGVRTAKPKVHASLLQPLTVLDMVVYYRPDQNLFRTKEIKAARTFLRIPFELPRSSVCMFAAEVVLKALRESEGHPELFEFLLDFLDYLDTTADSLANVPAFFLMQMVESLGFLPEYPDFGAPYYFDETQGYFLPHAPDHEHYAEKEISGFMVDLMGTSLLELKNIPSDRNIRALTIHILLGYIRSHVSGFQGITSHKVLGEVLGR